MPPCKVALSSMRNKILPIFPSQLVSGKCSSESLSWLLWFGDFKGLCFVGRKSCGSSRLSKLQWPDQEVYNITWWGVETWNASSLVIIILPVCVIYLYADRHKDEKYTKTHTYISLLDSQPLIYDELLAFGDVRSALAFPSMESVQSAAQFFWGPAASSWDEERLRNEMRVQFLWYSETTV